jgi:heme a synthase
VRRRLPTFSPRRVEQLTLIALATLGLIVLTGAAVRLTGSGLGCPNWPKCGDGVVAPLETHAWIEYGNRLASALVGLVCFAAGFVAWRRRPFRRDLAILGALLPLGVLMQGVLGGLTVLFHLKPGFVMGHFLLSMLLLCAAVALHWRARHEPEQLAEPREDPRLVKATRVLLPVGALAIAAGTLATAAGPHAGENEENDPVSRLDAFGTLDTVIHWHGRTGTLLGVSALVVWFLARRWGAGPALMRALTALCLLVAAQGVIGFAQYELELPAEIVWLHILVATAAWVALLFAVAAAGRLSPAPQAAAHRTDVESGGRTSPVLGSAGPHMR